MEIFSYTVPLWGLLLGGLVLIVVAWKLMKFAIKILFVLVAFVVILIGLDFFDVFTKIQEVLSSFL